MSADSDRATKPALVMENQAFEERLAGECPVHGERDGLRVLPDFADTGVVFCKTCGAKSDAYAAVIVWLSDWDFPTAPDTLWRTRSA
jgi:hypothetical protein